MFQLRKFEPKQVISQETIIKMRLRKYSPDQPRDDHGRFGSGGSSTSSNVIFEIAPNPDDVALSARWNSLTPEQKQAKNEEAIKTIVPQILAMRGVQGNIKTQFGSYENDTNQSFTLELPHGSDPAIVTDATKALGYNLSQKGMMTLSDKPFPGGELEDAIHITGSKDFTLLSSKNMYDELRGIKAGENPAVGGATTVGKTMTIVNYGKPMETDKLAEAIQAKFPDGYTIRKGQVYSWMASKEKDYGNYDNNSATAGGNMARRPVQGGSPDFRAAVRSLIEKTIRQAFRKFFNPEAIQGILKGGPGSGPRPGQQNRLGTGQGSSGKTPEELSNLIAPEKATLDESKTTLSKDGPHGWLAVQPWYTQTPGKDLTRDQVRQVNQMARQEIKTQVKPALQNFHKQLSDAGIQAKITWRPKTIQSSLDKMNGTGDNKKFMGRTASNLTDAIGTRVVFDTYEGMKQAIPMMEKSLGMVAVEHDNFSISGKNGGYRGEHFLFKTPNGVVFELQARTHVQDVFAHFSHSIYKPHDKMDPAKLQQARDYAHKVSDYLHQKGLPGGAGSKPAAPGWMARKGWVFPWNKVK